MAFDKWILLLCFICVCCDVDSTCRLNIPTITFGLFEVRIKSYVQHNTVFRLKKHNWDSWTLHTANHGHTNLLLYDKLCSNTLTVLSALFDLFFDVILWWFDWPVHWKRHHGLERYSSRDTDLFVADDCFFRIL